MCPTGALTFQPGPIDLRGSSICLAVDEVDFYTNKQGQLVKAMGNVDGPNRDHLCVESLVLTLCRPRNDSQPLIKKDRVEASCRPLIS